MGWEAIFLIIAYILRESEGQNKYFAGDMDRIRRRSCHLRTKVVWYGCKNMERSRIYGADAAEATPVL